MTICADPSTHPIDELLGESALPRPSCPEHGVEQARSVPDRPCRKLVAGPRGRDLCPRWVSETIEVEERSLAGRSVRGRRSGYTHVQ